MVDESHTVFFDHGLDHVPGMLMLHGVAELAELAGPESERGRVMGLLDLEFTRYVEKDLPTIISVAPDDAAHRWQARMTQDGHVVCAGTVGTIALEPAPGPVSPPGDAAIVRELADGMLVHRHRPENVVITPLCKADAGFTVDYVPSEAVRTIRFEEVHCPLDVVEAARQFMTLMCHEVCGQELGARLILSRLTVSMPELFPRTGSVWLHATPPVVTRSRIVFGMTAHCGQAAEAVVTWDIKAVTEAVYTRLRGGRHG